MSKRSALILLAVVLGVAIPVCVWAVAASVFEGKPTYVAGGATGCWIWTEADGSLHVRFSTKEKERKFEGKFCAEKISKLDPYHVSDNASNVVTIGGDGKCLSFALKVDKNLVGFNFVGEGPKVSFNIQMDNITLNSDRIWLGGHNTNPPTNPFELVR